MSGPLFCTGTFCSALKLLFNSYVVLGQKVWRPLYYTANVMRLHNYTWLAQCTVVSSVSNAVEGSEIVHAKSLLTRVSAFAFIDV